MKFRLLLMGITFALACSVVNGAILSNSFVVDDIEYYMQVNDSVFDLGEDVEALFKVTNLGDVTLSIGTSYPIIDIIVSEKVGEVYSEIWNWSWDQIYPAGPVLFELQPGEFVELNGTWSQVDLNNSVEVIDHTQVPPGIFRVSGYLKPTDTSVSIDINIIHEPVTYYVHADGSGDYPTIQEAIDAAEDLDEIVLSVGTYIGDGNRDIDFSGKAITVRGTDPNDADVVANTIIDCQGSEADIHRGFYFHSGEGANSVLKGLTITNGYAYKGGGILCEYSSPTIDSCIIRDNVSPILFSPSMAVGQPGGGIYCSKSSPIISNCQILYNTATTYGGGIYSYDGTALVRNCTIIGNQSVYIGGGGGVGLSKDSMFIKNCLIAGNRTSSNLHGSIGGGIISSRSTPTITGCTIVGNWTESEGGGIYVSDGSVLLSNSVLWCNDAPEGQEIGVGSGGFGPASLSVSYSDIMKGQQGISLYGDSTLIWGSGNIAVDPMFVDPGYWDDNATPGDPYDDIWKDGNYRLLPISPCIDTGDPDYIAEPDEIDIDGNPRIIGSVIDMGAYEANPIEASLRVMPRVINRQRQRPYIIAFVELPGDIKGDEINSDEMVSLYPGGIKAVWQKFFGGKGQGSAPRGSVVVAWFDQEQFLDEIPDNGTVEVDVAGQLKSGRYFTAASEIRIIDRKKERGVKRARGVKRSFR